MPTPGPMELIIILVIALIILGPGRLPDVGSALGKSIREFRKASSDIQESVKVDISTTPTAAAPQPPVAAPQLPVVAPTPEPAVAATAADLPGAPSTPSVPTSESQPPASSVNEPHTGTN